MPFGIFQGFTLFSEINLHRVPVVLLKRVRYTDPIDSFDFYKQNAIIAAGTKLAVYNTEEQEVLSTCVILNI